MRVLQATAWYPPLHLGGTEVYLTGLVRGLRSHGITSRIVAPLAPQADDGYVYDDAVVRTYPVNQEATQAELRGRKPHDSFELFYNILSEDGPDIYHQHSWTRGLGAHHLHAARKLGLKTVLTVHTPNIICLRGTMMRFGETPCDGELKVFRCAACRCHASGSSKQLAPILAAVPRATGSLLEAAGRNGRLITALSARKIVGERQDEMAQIVDDADRIVVVCQWLYDALTRNGVPAEKLVLSRQGVDDLFGRTAPECRPSQTRRIFRLVYIGRWHPVKGVDVLVKSIIAIPRNVSLELVIYGLGGGEEERNYEALIRKLAAQDSRISIAPPIPRERLSETLQEADALAVPSVWLETGPLVVLEAKALGLPVIGSRLGGIAELVDGPEDGILVTPNSVDAWTKAILDFSRNYHARARQRNPKPIRTMSDATEDMATLYRSLD